MYDYSDPDPLEKRPRAALRCCTLPMMTATSVPMQALTPEIPNFGGGRSSSSGGGKRGQREFQGKVQLCCPSLLVLKVKLAEGVGALWGTEGRFARIDALHALADDALRRLDAASTAEYGWWDDGTATRLVGHAAATHGARRGALRADAAAFSTQHAQAHARDDGRVQIRATVACAIDGSADGAAGTLTKPDETCSITHTVAVVVAVSITICLVATHSARTHTIPIFVPAHVAIVGIDAHTIISLAILGAQTTHTAAFPGRARTRRSGPRCRRRRAHS